MKRFLVTTAVVGAVLAAVPLQASVAAPPPLFTVSPASLSFTAPAGSTFPDDFAYQFVTVTNSTGRPRFPERRAARSRSASIHLFQERSRAR